jgi:hypothetical protein
MKTLWNYSNYGVDLRITRSDAQACTHSGPCDDDVKALMLKPYIKKQLGALNLEQLRKELKEYGAWDTAELSNHTDNLMRWLWLSCGDIIERA